MQPTSTSSATEQFIPWVPEVFSLARRSSAAETFRGRPKAEATSEEEWVTIKTWPKPETAKVSGTQSKQYMDQTKGPFNARDRQIVQFWCFICLRSF